jgi:hypothetical protein
VKLHLSRQLRLSARLQYLGYMENVYIVLPITLCQPTNITSSIAAQRRRQCAHKSRRRYVSVLWRRTLDVLLPRSSSWSHISHFTLQVRYLGEVTGCAWASCHNLQKRHSRLCDFNNTSTTSLEHNAFTVPLSKPNLTHCPAPAPSLGQEADVASGSRHRSV